MVVFDRYVKAKCRTAQVGGRGDRPGMACCKIRCSVCILLVRMEMRLQAGTQLGTQHLHTPTSHSTHTAARMPSYGRGSHGN